MKSLDVVSQRIMSVCVGLSLVLVSAAILIFSVSSVHTAQAAPEHAIPLEESNLPWDASVRGSVGLGIVNNTGYFVVYSNPNMLYKVDLSEARNWYDD